MNAFTVEKFDLVFKSTFQTSPKNDRFRESWSEEYITLYMKNVMKHETRIHYVKLRILFDYILIDTRYEYESKPVYTLFAGTPIV